MVVGVELVAEGAEEAGCRGRAAVRDVAGGVRGERLVRALLDEAHDAARVRGTLRARCRCGGPRCEGPRTAQRTHDARELHAAPHVAAQVLQRLLWAQPAVRPRHKFFLFPGFW